MSADAVLTVAQMRNAEQAAMGGGTSEWELMQRAGAGAAQWVWRVAAGRAVTVLCGPGNNGGDGYVIAEWLRARGTQVSVVAPVEPKTATAAQARGSFGGRIAERAEGPAAPVLVDCLFGYGLSRPVEGAFAEVLKSAARSHPVRIAIDVPSGVESDTGALLSDTPRFDLTLALGAWKQAHFLMPAAARMGARRLVPIGIDLPATDAARAETPRFAAPGADAHKYTRGLLAIVAGKMPGAPILAAEAAMRAGAGYVKLFSDHSHPDAPAELVVEQGDLAESLDDGRIGAMLIGPGLGRGAGARERLARAVEAGFPSVLDADALYLLDGDLLAGAEGKRLLLTPHDGELARLCESFGVTAEGKLDRAQRLRDVTGANVLAKGPDTLLATADGKTLFFPRGPSWLSVAGSGDVLAGSAAGRLGGHGDLARAAREAVFLQQEAAQLAGPAFTAGELARSVGSALATLL
ncbi:MAG: NAD(P)H-hydrate epimerase [Qipengyuania sp.]